MWGPQIFSGYGAKSSASQLLKKVSNTRNHFEKILGLSSSYHLGILPDNLPLPLFLIWADFNRGVVIAHIWRYSQWQHLVLKITSLDS